MKVNPNQDLRNPILVEDIVEVSLLKNDGFAPQTSRDLFQMSFVAQSLFRTGRS
jgi:hypothetical protein